MFNSLRLPGVVLFAIVLSLAPVRPAPAQVVPEGACELDDGDWCWPIRPVLYGETCACVTEEGEENGLGR